MSIGTIRPVVVIQSHCFGGLVRGMEEVEFLENEQEEGSHGSSWALSVTQEVCDGQGRVGVQDL